MRPTAAAWLLLVRGLLVVGLVVAWVISGRDTADEPLAPGSKAQRDAIDVVEHRPFWVSSPATFLHADVWIGDVAQAVGGEVVAVRPRELVEDPQSYKGRSIYVVGKVVRIRHVGSRPLVQEEYRIIGAARGFDAYVGTDRVNFVSPGDVIFALGRLAAVGTSRLKRGGRIKTAYLLALGSTEIRSLDTPRWASPSISKAARGLRNPRTSYDWGADL